MFGNFLLKYKFNSRAGLEHVSNTSHKEDERSTERDRSRKRSCTPTNGSNIIAFDAGSTA
jgi:hypothetical protein